jgi:hypothetical protein
MWSKNAKPPTKKQLRDMAEVKTVGCVCCWKMGFEGVMAAFDHTVRGNKRVGHHDGLGLCDWHHQGYTFEGMTKEQCIAERGPTLADGSKPFYAFFGSREELQACGRELVSKYGESKST